MPKIGPRIAAVTRPAKSEIAILPKSVDQVDLHLHEVTADRNLVTAADPVETVAEMEVLAVEVAGVASPDAEVTGHGQN